MNNQLYTKLNKNFIKHNKILFKVIKTKKIIIKNFLMLIKLLFNSLFYSFLLHKTIRNRVSIIYNLIFKVYSHEINSLK